MSPADVTPEIENAVLVGIQTPDMDEQDLEGSLTELNRLVTTLGYNVVGRVTQKQSSTKKATVLGEGKLKELAGWTGGTGIVARMVQKKLTKAALKWQQEEELIEDVDDGDDLDDSDEPVSLKSEPKIRADVVVVDAELSPSQLRNLESATGVEVLDRTGVIIEIFARHARTRAARLQVEIARLTYVAPRLREANKGRGDRQGGGIGAKGAGETSLELDRRRIRDRIKELREELEAIGDQDEQRRSRREEELTVALVGYTNAGKSSLMRALTGSDVLVENKLFATLDTTVRAMHPETQPRILVSDTVGFIDKLPHDLVASFKSTLDEASQASLLLYVVDASDLRLRTHLEVTRSVLSEVGAGDLPSILVMNKRDLLKPEDLQELRKEYPDAVFLSAHNPDDIASLRERIIAFFDRSMVEDEILIPYSDRGTVGEVRSRMRVLAESYTEQGVQLRVRALPAHLARAKKRLQASGT